MEGKDQKILIIQPHIPPYRVPFFEELGKRYNITVLYFSGDPGATGFKKIRYQGVMYHLRLIRYTPGIYRIAKEYDCVIIMFDLWWLNLALLPFMLDNKRTRAILWGHGIGRTHGLKPATLVRGLIAAKARALIFYTKETKELFISKTGVKDNKCFVANNTILVKQLASDPLQQEKKYFLYLGRLQVRKRINVLLQAYALLNIAIRQQHPLLIVGSGDHTLLMDLQQLAMMLDIADTVSFAPGTYDESQVAEYYSRAVAYVSPGAVGLGVVQSFAYSVPVVTAANIDHGPEFGYCNNENSYLYMNSNDEIETIQNLAQILMLVVNDRVLWRQRSLVAQYTYNNECSMEKMINGFAAAISYSSAG